jgi:glycosyltransferase involved in cell wall biosynthesis
MTKLSVVVPVFNEAPDVIAVLERLLAAECPIEREVLVIDDGSTDGTARLLEEFAAGGEVRLIRRDRRGGKGAAVADGIAAASGEYLIVHDADHEYDPRDIPRLLEPLLEDRADVVYGSRFRRECTTVHRTFHYLANRLLTDLSNAFSGIYLTDVHTCYKLFRADLVKAMRLRSRAFGFDAEATAYLAKIDVRIMELPISYRPRTREDGKKITWIDGVAALWHLVHFNLLVSRKRAFDRLPARYLSTKGRAGVPREREPKVNPHPMVTGALGEESLPLVPSPDRC